MKPEKYHSDLDALPNTKALRMNIVGSFFILFISLASIQFILLPEVRKEFVSASFSQNLSARISLIVGLLLVIFLIGFPLYLIIQAIRYYRDARALDQNGILTKGYVVEKWVEDAGNKLVYYVRYQYLRHMNAIQVVTKDAFQQLSQGQDVSVSILEHLPHISRIRLDGKTRLNAS
jgi:hypothetical protein